MATHLFKDHCRKNWPYISLLSVLTVGVYTYRLKKSCESKLLGALSFRKITHYETLASKIEEARKKHTFEDPKTSVRHIYTHLIKEDESITKIFTKSDLLLFITTPLESALETDLYEDPEASWKKLKADCKNQESSYIKEINIYYSLLKNRYLLSKEEIHERLLKAREGKDPSELTILKNLCEAFKQLLFSFEKLMQLKKTHFEHFEILSSLLNLTSLEINLFLKVLDNEKFFKTLPVEMKKYLLFLVAKETSLFQIFKEPFLSETLLALNQSQFHFLHKLHTELTEKKTLLYKLSKCFLEKLSPCPDFCLKLLENLSHNPPFLLKKISDPEALEKILTKGFFSEMNTPFAHLDLFFHNEHVAFEKTSLLCLDRIEAIYLALTKLAENDKELLLIMQEAISKPGKKIITSTICKAFEEVLGEKSELLELTLAKITITKINRDHFEIEYLFEKSALLGDTFSPSLVQELHKIGGSWSKIA